MSYCRFEANVSDVYVLYSLTGYNILVRNQGNQDWIIRKTTKGCLNLLKRLASKGVLVPNNAIKRLEKELKENEKLH